jgi:hypothetical protein
MKTFVPLGLGCALLSWAAGVGRGNPGPAGENSHEQQAMAAAPAGHLQHFNAHTSCLLADSLLRRLPRGLAITVDTSRKSVTATHLGDAWTCRMVAAGRASPASAAVDSIIGWLRARGWSELLLPEADSPDGTVQGMRLGEVTCVTHGRWDGGDDTDPGYAPSDTVEIRIACRLTTRSDTASWR